ncbi:hypothetical protein PHMEG_00022845 [Phytophthora megakarya]|uniref:Ubiquitin-like protease family profile domain-containing protein n=1 Tax=Phytophthora megakarya TaxID=4795 RepID=A0A225VIH2_9STRA|nr:hypothetical protein PHMEG_00022845 [Phytophthora megakarya]
MAVNPKKGILDKVVMEIMVIPTLMNFQVTPANGPLQRDSFSCGMFVARFFWKLDPSIEDAPDGDFLDFRIHVITAFLGRTLSTTE